MSAQACPGCSLFSSSFRASNLVEWKAAFLKGRKFALSVQHLINL